MTMTAPAAARPINVSTAGGTLDWKLTMPSGDEFRSESRFGPLQPNVPIDISGVVSLAGTTVVIATPDGDFELAFTRDAAPLDAAIPAGAAVRVKGQLSNGYTMSPQLRWWLDLEIRNDPSGGGTEMGERLFLLTGTRRTDEGRPIAVDLDDACEVGENTYQHRWLVGEAGKKPTVVPEGGSLDVHVSSGTDAGAYEFLGGDATFPLEGDGSEFFLIRRAPE
jgi:hypothetical protein